MKGSKHTNMHNSYPQKRCLIYQSLQIQHIQFYFILNHLFQVQLSFSTMVLSSNIQHSIQSKTIQINSIQLFAFQFCFILFNMFQNITNTWIISGLTFFLHHGLRSIVQILNLIYFNSIPLCCAKTHAGLDLHSPFHSTLVQILK